MNVSCVDWKFSVCFGLKDISRREMKKKKKTKKQKKKQKTKKKCFNNILGSILLVCVFQI